MQPHAAKPRCYSYMRFSTPEQAKGDSLNRQSARASSWATANGYELDKELTFKDLGVSAYRGKNAATGALGAFLEAVEDGRVPRDSYLIVESLDRISRQAVRKAARTLEDICEAGINVVDLEDGGRVYNLDTLDGDQFAFIMMVLRFQRANAESVIKGTRVRAAYDTKRKKARDQAADRANGNSAAPMDPFTRKLPGWLRWDEKTREVVLIKDHAKVVKDIFRAAKDGKGQRAIANDLNQRGVPVFGKAQYWHRAFVQNLLRNPSVLGTFTPHLREIVDGKRQRKPLDPIENYFPAVIDMETWTAVQQRMSTTQARGRHANQSPSHLFAGLLRCSLCGGGMTRFRTDLVCARANSKGGCRRLPLKSEDVEHAVVDRIANIVKTAPLGPSTADLEAEAEQLAINLDAAETAERELVEEILQASAGTKSALRAQLSKIGTEKDTLQETLRGVMERRDALAPTWVAAKLKAFQKALQAYGKAKGPEAKSAALLAGNGAARAALARLDLDPLQGTIGLHWHHAAEERQEVRVASKWVFSKIHN
jgi:DNA invertase Pin-like site-specific DNA recombinase